VANSCRKLEVIAEIFQRVYNSKMCPLGGQLGIVRQVFMSPTSLQNLKSLAIAVAEIFQVVSGDFDHVRNDLSSAGWDLLPLTYRPTI